MDSATLIRLAGVFTKDPDHNVYSSSDKYAMLSVAQVSVIKALHPDHLFFLKEKKTFSNVSSPGTFTIGTPILVPLYLELSNGTPAKFIQVDDRERLRNSFMGGTDADPMWTVYYQSGTGDLIGQVFLSTYPVTFDVYYISTPPDISAAQDPVLYGFEDLILLYFKYLFHLSEGQQDIAMATYKSFIDRIALINSGIAQESDEEGENG